MNITLLLKSLDHLFVWRSPAEITIMAVARFCWPDVAIYEDNCNVLVITAVQFSTEYQENRFYISIDINRYHCRGIEAHRDRSVARDCLESLHTIATHHWICDSQPQLRLLLTIIFSKKNPDECRVSIFITAVSPAPCDKNNSRHYSIVWLYLSQGAPKEQLKLWKKWHCIFAVLYLRQQTTTTS